MRSARLLKAALATSRVYGALSLHRVPGLARVSRFVGRRLFKASSELPVPYAEVSLDGTVLFVPKMLSGNYVSRHFENLSRRVVETWLRAGSVVVDVGANIGFHTVHFGRLVGPTGKVLALEPAPENLAFLRKNVEANGLHQVQVLPYAAGSDRRERLLYLHSHAALHSFYLRDETEPEHLSVAQRPLDELVDEPKVDVVKIDTEGAEMEVLRGMREILAANPEIKLLVEWNLLFADQNDRRVDELPSFLRGEGFAVEVIDDQEGRVREVEEVLASLRGGSFGAHRALNLAAERRPSPTPAGRG